MTAAAQRRGFNEAVTRFWGFAAPAYNLPLLQQWVYLDAVVTTSAFHFFDQPAALRDFHRVLSPGGLVAVSTLSARQLLPQGPATSRWKPAHHPSAAEMRRLFEDAGFTVTEQHGVRRPLLTRALSDLITAGVKG